MGGGVGGWELTNRSVGRSSYLSGVKTPFCYLKVLSLKSGSFVVPFRILSQTNMTGDNFVVLELAAPSGEKCKATPILSYRRGKSLTDMLIKAKL